MEKNKIKLIMVNWLDSCQPAPNWQHLSDYKKVSPVSCVSVGFLIHDGDKTKAIAPNMGEIHNKENIQASGIIHIPTCCITNITELTET